MVLIGSTVSLLVFVPPYRGLAVGNHVRVAGPPTGKIPGLPYQAAKVLVHYAAANTMIAAPQRVAIWIPSFHHHPYVTDAREVYLRQIEIEYGEAEGDFRMLMSERLLDQRDVELRIRESERLAKRAADPKINEKFRAGLDRYAISAVCLNLRAPDPRSVQIILASSGFKPAGTSAFYQIWLRKPAASRSTKL